MTDRETINRVRVRCDCGCEILEISKLEMDYTVPNEGVIYEYLLSRYLGINYFNKLNLIDKIKLCFNILFNDKIKINELCLSQEDFNLFKKQINKL